MVMFFGADGNALAAIVIHGHHASLAPSLMGSGARPIGPVRKLFVLCETIFAD